MAEGSRVKGGGRGEGYYTFGGNSAGGSSGSTGRAWGEVFARSALSKPTSSREAFSRIKRNLSYFRRNYAIFILVLVGLSLLWRPISLLVLVVLAAAWIYLYFSRSGPVVLFNRPIGENLVLAFLIVLTVVALAFTPEAGIPLSVSIPVGFALVLLHGAFRIPDDLSSSDQQDNSALLGDKGGATGSARA